MLDGVGPGSYADREDIPELTMEDIPCIVPLRLAEGTYLEARDPDPRGMRVLGADSEVGGVVTDVWVDRAEALIRWRHPVRGLLSPGEFMPVVNTSPISERIAEWVLQTACATAAGDTPGWCGATRTRSAPARRSRRT